MKLNKLLEEQLKSGLPEKYRDDTEIMSFLQLVSDTYESKDSETDQLLLLSTKKEDSLSNENANLKEQLLLKNAEVGSGEVLYNNEKYRRIIENMNLGLLQVSPNEVIIYANQSFCEMSGYGIDELVGRNTASIFVQKDKQPLIDAVKERRETGESDAYEIQVLNKQGEEKWWLISGAPILNDNNEFVGSIGIHLDITSQKQLERELRKANNDAEISARAKELFLANISHEIRTPMNAIIGLGRLLSRTRLDAQQIIYLDIIRNASDTLLFIINDLLDFSKIEAGKVVLEEIGFNVKDAIDNSLHILRHKAEEKGISLDCVYDDDLSKVFIGDPYRLSQVIMNLLSNSIKFTEKGEITVHCNVQEEDEKSQLLRFVVVDTGIGMSEEFLDHLFDKFTQEDESITRKFGGTGLGMSICKQLIELMGGQIEVASRKNVGTTVSFSLRFTIGSETDLPKLLITETDTQALKDKRILLVEDNSMNRVLAKTILSQYGAEVIEAVDGAIAVEVITKMRFDLLLMDIQMPVMNGLEATKYIRTNIDKTIPIIAMTAYANKHEEQLCLQAGMNDFISKPFDEDRMVQLVAQWLGRETVVKEKVTKVKKVSKSSTQSTPALFDLSKVRAFGGGDEDFVVNLAGLFLSESEGGIANMEVAFAKKDFEMVAGMAHKIKPSMFTFGVVTAVSELEQIESLSKQKQSPERIANHIANLKQICSVVFGQLRVAVKIR